MSIKYKFSNPDAIYFVTFSVIGWIDVFTRIVYKEILLETFRYCVKQKGLIIYGYVIMSNHVHMIISRNGDNSLSDIMRDMKKFSSVKIIKEIIENPQESRKSGFCICWLKLVKQIAIIRYINYGNRTIIQLNLIHIPTCSNKK